MNSTMICRSCSADSKCYDMQCSAKVGSQNVISNDDMFGGHGVLSCPAGFIAKTVRRRFHQ